MGGGGGVGGTFGSLLLCGAAFVSCSFPQTLVKNPPSEADVSNHLGCRVFLSPQRCPGSADGGMMAAVLRL